MSCKSSPDIPRLGRLGGTKTWWADGAALCGHTLAWLELLCYWKLGSTDSRGEIFQMIINKTFLVRAEVEYCTIETVLLDWKMIQLNNFENILD